MIVRAGTGWQYALADLSLILFMVTASALARAGGPDRPLPPPLPPPPPIAAAMGSEPVAVWSAGPQAPPLAPWLDQTGADRRLEVSVVLRYTDGGRERAMLEAAQLVRQGGARARSARILVEPGTRAGASVSLAYASEAAALAR